MLPDKLVNFMAYSEAKQIIGVADVTLPEIVYMTDSIKGAGLAGEIDSPVIGNTQSMTVTINWRNMIDQNANFAAPKTYLFDLRGSSQSYDEHSGEYKTSAIRCIIKCIPKKFSPGKFESSASMGTSGEFETLYLKILIDNKELIEIDKINSIFKVGGVDYLAKVRKDIGLA